MTDRDDAGCASRLMPDHARPVSPLAGGGLAWAGPDPSGVALVYDDGIFHIDLRGADSAPPMRLGPYGEDEVVAIWRSLAAASGLPLLVVGPDGVLRQPYPQLGRLVLGGRIDTRRLAVLDGRRPRFLVRRKPGRAGECPPVHREPEMARGASR